MKKFLLVSLIVSILSVASYGQQTDTIITLPEIRLTAPSAVNANVTSAFRRTFPDAENLRWYRYDKDYLAKFIMYDMDHNSLFRKSGVMKYDISYGFERHIPEKIKEEVTNAYDNYQIIRAINIKAENRDIWIIKMEGAKKYLTVRVEDGELDEVESFFKSAETDR